MSPVAEADGDDFPGLIDECIPGGAAVIEDVVVGLEDAVREPVVAQKLPDVFDGIEFRGTRRQRHQGDVAWDDEVLGDVPSGLVEQHDGMRIGGNGGCDLGEVQGHRCGIATRHDDRRPLALGRADGAEEIGRGGPLILRRRGPGAAPGPAPGDRVFLPDPGFILEPDLYALALGGARRELCQRGGEVFLNVVKASGSCAWWRGRADSLR